MSKYDSSRDLASKIIWEGGLGEMLSYGWPSLEELPDDLPQDVSDAFVRVGGVSEDIAKIGEWIEGFEDDSTWLDDDD